MSQDADNQILRPTFRAVEAGQVVGRVGTLDLPVLTDRSGVVFNEQVFVPDDLLEDALALLTRMGLRRG